MAWWSAGRWGKRSVGWLGWPTAVAVIAALTFAYALPQRLTDTTPGYARLAAAAFFGRVLTFHAGLLLLAIGTVAIWSLRWRLTAVALLAAAVTLAPTLYACRPRTPPSHVGRPLRVMAMNVKYTNRDATDILAQVRRYSPDVLTVEEVGPQSERAIALALADDYPYRAVHARGGVGLGLYSRLPFDGPPRLTYRIYQRHLRGVVRLAGRPVAIYVLHPISPRTVQRVVWNRLTVAELLPELRRERLPTILAGDFNFTAETPNAAAIRSAGYTDAFDVAGWGRGSTWPVRPRWAAWLPGVRIDHVYLSPGLTCAGYATGGYTGSDHLPIVADIAWSAGR